MGYKCKILLDSISEIGKRLTTFEVTFPRIVLAEFNTHRMLSRNSASSRAIPFNKQIERVNNDPFIPEQFPLNCSGMQPQEYVVSGDPAYKYYVDYWLGARNNAVSQAIEFYELKKPHKQILNRLIEPFMWHTVIVTATEFDNFFKLRTHPDAQYEIKRIADLMYEAYYECEQPEGNSNIQKLKVGEWHCPLVSHDDELSILYYIGKQDNEAGEYQRETKWRDFKSIESESWNNGSAEVIWDEILEIKKKISVARCARVSYLTHEGKRDIEKDLELFERLRTSGHWSPFEHVATPYYKDLMSSQPVIDNLNEGINEGFELWGKWINLRSGNFTGWKQYRKEFQDENCTNFRSGK